MTELLSAFQQRVMSPIRPIGWVLLFLYVCAVVPGIMLYPRLVLPISGAVLAFLAIFFEPFLGILIAAILAMVGELQHFAGSVSVAKFVFLFTLFSFLARWIMKKSIQLAKTGLEIPVFVFILIYSCGVFMTLDRFNEEVYARGVQTIVTMLGYPLAFLLFLNLVNTEERIKWVLYAVAFGAFITGVISVVQQFTGINLLSQMRGIEQVAASNAAGMDRQDGLMMDPNAAAYPQLIGLPISLLLLISARTPMKRFLLSIMAIVCMFGLALTFSRSAYIGIAGGVISAAFFLRGQRTVKIYAAFGIFLFVLTAFIPTSTLLGRFEMIGGELDGVSDRSIYFKTAVRELIEHPVLPAGELSFMARIDQAVGVSQGPHANLQAIMINSGILGLAAAAWLLFRYVFFVSRGLRTMPDSALRNYAVGTCMAIVSFQVQGFFITNMSWFLLWAILAIPLCCVLIHNADLQSLAQAHYIQ
jgi:hypothetical protein